MEAHADAIEQLIEKLVQNYEKVVVWCHGGLYSKGIEGLIESIALTNRLSERFDQHPKLTFEDPNIRDTNFAGIINKVVANHEEGQRRGNEVIDQYFLVDKVRIWKSDLAFKREVQEEGHEIKPTIWGPPRAESEKWYHYLIQYAQGLAILVRIKPRVVGTFITWFRSIFKPT
ncbi:MAG TPA: hypothetical protein VLA04_03645 [Verrucomicrobiae bacterium]|nr:hypothetical protein [Verrucomicrobiae bacterium]